MLRATLLSCLLVQCLAGRTPLQNDRIVAGGLADQGEYPSQVDISFTSEYINYGAGSILNEKYVLTAGHCVDRLPLDDLSIRAGNINITAAQIHKVVRVIMHEDFGWDMESFLRNDIAIIEVSPPFTFGPNVQPITLASQGDVPAVGSVATAIGWGNTKFNGTGSEILKEVEIKISDQDLCTELYDGLGYKLLPGHICAGLENVGTCQGDSGGPLFVDGVSVGVTSWSGDICGSVLPSVFTRVAYYRDWITQQIGI